MKKDCDYKVRYITKEEAEDAVSAYYERVVLSIDPVTAYWCHKHDCFHIGHKRPLADILSYKIMCMAIKYSDVA